MSDIRDRLREKLAGAAESLPRGEAGKAGEAAAQRLLGRGTVEERAAAAEQMRETITRESAAPLGVWYVLDTTGSMDPYIIAVRQCITAVGRETLSAQKGIEARILGVGDHGDKYQLERARLPYLIGDFGQGNMPTTSADILTQQVADIINTHGGDIPEAYECMAAHLVQAITQEQITTPQKKQVVVWMGDAYPHQPMQASEQEIVSSRKTLGYNYYDDRCPFQRGPEQLVALAGLVSRSYWIDCNSASDSPFRRLTFAPVEQFQTAHYLRFADAQSVLPEALIGMVKEAESKAAYETYLKDIEKVDAGKAQQVAGLLGTGRK